MDAVSVLVGAVGMFLVIRVLLRILRKPMRAQLVTRILTRADELHKAGIKDEFDALQRAIEDYIEGKV